MAMTTAETHQLTIARDIENWPAWKRAGINVTENQPMAEKYTYNIETQHHTGEWVKLCTHVPLSWARGFVDCAREFSGQPRLAMRIIRSDGRVLEEMERRDDVAIGACAGWPEPEQYERAAARALETAAKIRAARAKGHDHG